MALKEDLINEAKQIFPNENDLDALKMYAETLFDELLSSKDTGSKKHVETSDKYFDVRREIVLLQKDVIETTSSFKTVEM